MKHVRGILLFGPPGTGKTLTVNEQNNNYKNFKLNSKLES